MSSWIGRTLSKVEIQRLLGRGGMAEVYLGRHVTLNRTVAVKVLHGHLSGDETVLSRFRSEAQAVAAMRHPNIVQVFDFDVADDQPYIVMEYIDGPSLSDYLRSQQRANRRLPPEMIARLLTPLASALDYAHARSIVHRDVKPSNVLLQRESGYFDLNGPLPEDIQPVLTDFGVARIANATLRTASGVIVGTPAYMSPEQVSGEQVDARSDIYSMGIMLYEMLAARLPFDSEADTVASTLIKHITEAPPPLPEVPRSVETVVMRALAKDRTARYQRAGELALDLRAAYGLPMTPLEMAAITPGSRPSPYETKKLPKPRERKQWPLIAAGLVVLLLILGGAGLLLSGVLSDDKDDSTTSGDHGHGGTDVPIAAGDMTPYGALAFSDAEADLDRVTLRVEGLAVPTDGTQYEAWLLGSETRRSLGTFEVDDSGNAEISYTSVTGENLLELFGSLEITLEPFPDQSPLPTSEVAYSGAVHPGPLTHIRHVLVSFGNNPDHVGLMIGVKRDSELIQASAQALLEAQQASDLDGIKQQAEAMVNVIEGKAGEHYGDLDGDGTITDPSDGVGLLLSADSTGYIQTAIEHARYATGTEGVSQEIATNAALFEVAAQNLGGWAVQIRDLSWQLLESNDADQVGELAQQIVDLTTLFMDGQDSNNNGQIEPVPGEGGVQTAYAYALNMADMILMEGSNRMPPAIPVVVSDGAE
ncbi:MAG TPA: serine/threonine-protein kinase [Aggregatilineaceae bacterium]|nr:serine/threonine-protein kinase [Aggregatilineaceae bacterium]